MLFFCLKIKKRKMEIAKIDSHVEQSHDVATAPNAKLEVIYAVAKPILIGVCALLFWKPKWQAVINALISGLDTYTGTVAVS